MRCMLLTACLLLLLCLPGAGQYPRFIFRNPLGIPMHLIANFGEVRNDHYHMGLDLRTQQRENLPVFAAAEGYVSRVTIEPGGYGKCIYVTHPNGYTTLYAHLNRFYPALEAYVQHKQYSDEKWEQDFVLSRTRFPVGKGQLIAYSGSTGAVEGPHLHFEVRNTRTGNNINPLFLGFPVKDNLQPLIYNLYLYDRSYSTYAVEPEEIRLRGSKGKYSTRDSVVYTGAPRFSFSISAEDMANGSNFRFGIYGAELWMDSVMQFSFQLREFNREDSKYVNASIDYRKWMTQKKRIQHLSRLPGNHLFTKEGEHDGMIELHDTLEHQVWVVVTDAAANESVLRFRLQYRPELTAPRLPVDSTVKFVPGKENAVQREELKVQVPGDAIYDTVDFTVTKVSAGIDGLPVFNVGNIFVPLHEPYTVSLTPTTEQLRPDKVVMRMTGRKLEVVKPEWVNGTYAATFGVFGVLVTLEDSIPPMLGKNWEDSAVFYRNGSIVFTAKDIMSTIASVRAEIDGNWAPFEQKGNIFSYKFDGYLENGKHTLRVLAKDVAGNETSRTWYFELKEKAPVKKKPVTHRKKQSSKKKNGNTPERK